MIFTEQVKEQAQASWQGNLQHPFITKLHEGTLSPAIFRYYLIQDHYYLKHLSQLYRSIAAQARQPRLKKLFLTNAENLALGELVIRETSFEELVTTEEEVVAIPTAPTAYRYAFYMYCQLIEGTPKTAAVGMLPCSWLYQEIGVQLVEQHSLEPLYQRWIETYAGEEAYQHVQEERQLLDQLYEESSPQEQATMITVFAISNEVEYAFWEMACTHETRIG